MEVRIIFYVDLKNIQTRKLNIRLNVMTIIKYYTVTFVSIKIADASLLIKHFMISFVLNDKQKIYCLK